jgi:hypothetical protein
MSKRAVPPALADGVDRGLGGRGEYVLCSMCGERGTGWSEPTAGHYEV